MVVYRKDGLRWPAYPYLKVFNEHFIVIVHADPIKLLNA